jgi:DNA invertase Pin-like site-specific DNA recombinase
MATTKFINILYTRISTRGQNSDRQKQFEKIEFQKTISDVCSGSIPFFERNGGKEIQFLIDKKIPFKLHVQSIDRLGRNLIDILQTIQYFNEHLVPVTFLTQGITTLDEHGKQQPLTQLLISILGIIAEMEKEQIKERQLDGIALAKMSGRYLGRKKGTKESASDFLNKPKHKHAIKLLTKNNEYKISEIAKITGLHRNTITKLKKIYSSQQSEITALKKDIL